MEQVVEQLVEAVEDVQDKQQPVELARDLLQYVGGGTVLCEL